MNGIYGPPSPGLASGPLANSVIPYSVSGALTGDAALTYDPTNKIVNLASGAGIGMRGLVRGQGALNTNPGGGSPPLWWWANGSVLDANDFGHGDKTLMELLDTNSTPTSGPMLRLVRTHTGAVGGTDLLHTTVLNISSYSPGTSNGNNETSAIFLGPTGAANGLTIYKSNAFNPVGATDYSTFGSKAVEIGSDDAGDCMEISPGFGGVRTYQTQGLTISMGGGAFYPSGVKGVVVQPGAGTFDDREAFAVGSHVLNGANTSQRWQVLLSGKEFNTQQHTSGAGQNTGAFDQTGALGGSLLLNDTTTSGVGYGGALLFGNGGSLTTPKIFAAIKGFAQDASNNTVGDLIFATRNARTDATLTERFRLTAAGLLQGTGTTVGMTLSPLVTPGASNADGIVLGSGTVATGSTSFGIWSGVHIKASSKSGTGVITQAFGLQVDAPVIAGSSNVTALFNGQVNISGLAYVSSLSYQVDNMNDLGNSGANRPRTGYFGTDVVVNGKTVNFYDFGGGFVGKPTSAAVDMPIPIPRALTIPANMTGAQAIAKTGATSSAAFTIAKVSGGVTTTIGTLTFASAGQGAAQVGTFTTPAGAAQSLAAGDYVIVTAPTQDATLADIGYVITGTWY